MASNDISTADLLPSANRQLHLSRSRHPLRIATSL